MNALGRRDGKPRCFATFPSVHHVLAAEERLLNRGAPVRLVQVPRQLSSDCGTALEFDCDSLERIRSLLARAKIEYAVIHRVESGTARPVG